MGADGSVLIWTCQIPLPHGLWVSSLCKFSCYAMVCYAVLHNAILPV